MAIAFLHPACGCRRRRTQDEVGSMVVCRGFRPTTVMPSILLFAGMSPQSVEAMLILALLATSTFVMAVITARRKDRKAIVYHGAPYCLGCGKQISLTMARTPGRLCDHNVARPLAARRA